MSVVTILLLLILPLGAATAAILDLTTYTLPNWLTLGIALVFIVVAQISGVSVADITLALITGLGVLVLGFCLFTWGLFGGGDAKLAAALACWFGPAEILPFMILTALIGGVLALFIVALRALPDLSSIPSLKFAVHLQDPAKGVPYGVALGAAALLLYPNTFIWRSLLS